MSARGRAMLVGLVAGCASAPAPPTIEPPQPGRLSPEEAEFVLSRRPPERRLDDEPPPPIHTGEAWWGFRAQFLGISDRQARLRDAALSERQPPADFWDEQTATEAVHLWSALCNECHGGRRRLEDVLAMPPPAPPWGHGEGLFFGRFRPYAEMFSVIAQGGPERGGLPSDMPGWRGKIAREQIWALLYFLEFQSGGIGGPLPPSLQPRRSGEVRRVLQ